MSSPNRALPAVVAVLLALADPGRAMGHGDPASHYLEAEPLYPAFANRPSQTVELQLLGLLQATERRGYPIKVALVAGEGDLTDEPAMLRRPQRYAEFVGRELGEGLRAPILVVTPFGFGVSGAGVRRSVVGAVQPQAGGDALARAAMAAVRQLARAGGHPLPADVPPAPMLGSNAPAATGSNELVRVAALFGVTFLLLFEAFELWARRGRPRGASHARRTPRRTARASAPHPPARRS